MDNSVIDLIIRIKNGYMSRREIISSPYSKFREQVVIKLKKIGYIKDFQVSGDLKKTIDIELSYHENEPVLTDVKIYSTSGQRQYVSYKNLRPIVNNFGVSLLSTSKGIMTNKEAKKNKLGGELLFAIW